METNLVETMTVTLLLCFLFQGKCIKKCLEKYRPSHRPTMPGKVADEKNDPRRRPHPTFGPLVVNSVCFITSTI